MKRPLRKTALGSILFAGALLAVAVTVEAQQAKKIPRIGLLSTLSAAAVSDRIEAFRQGLHELGYVEGENILIEWRGAGLVSALAEELVRLKVDIIVTVGSGGTRAAKAVTSTIPHCHGE